MVNSHQPAAPGTVLEINNHQIIVATSVNAIALEVLQLPGKKAMPVKDILNGKPDWLKVGDILVAKNLRADAAKVVFSVLEQSLRECLTPLLESHSDKDKAWIQEMVYGVLGGIYRNCNCG